MKSKKVQRPRVHTPVNQKAGPMLSKSMPHPMDMCDWCGNPEWMCSCEEEET